MPYIGNTTSDFSIDTGNITNRAVTATKLSPSSVGSNGQVLSVDGSGNLQWSADASGTALTGSTNNTITTVTGANAIQGEANLTFDGSSLAVTGSSTFTGTVSFGGAGSYVGSNVLRFSPAGTAYIDHEVIDQEIHFRVSNTPVGSLGLTALVIKADGKVGIGTASPNSILHIGAADNTNHEAILTLNNGGASGQEAGIEWLYEASTTPRAKIHLDSSQQSLTFSTANSVALGIDSSQRVGIGTTIPGTVLEVQGAQAYADSASTLATAVSKSAFRVKGSNNSSDSLWMGVEASNALPYIQGANSPGNASKTLLLNPFGGLVGIGTTSPQGNLEIEGDATGPVLTISGGTNSRTAAGILMEGGVSATDNSGIWTKYSLVIGCNQTNAIASRSINFNNGDTGLGSWLSTGNLQITNGDLTVVNGHGIDFSASESSNTTSSSVLSDYEEGSWTPTFNGLGNYFAYAVWRYTKIGNLVQFGGRLVCTSTTNSGSDNVTFNLPFASAANITNSLNDSVGIAMTLNINTNGHGIVGHVPSDTSTCYFNKTQDNAGWDNLSTDDVSVDDQLIFSMTYRAA